ncbi:MFS transporter, partial [Streptomyces sp. NPDC127079]|uniref:MFS transporter n=1 Tax=Streptomyces sp. NPDC127079 TaxID=3347132 RepID=UPI0036601F88
MNHLAAPGKPIPPRAAFYVLASVVVSFLAASSAPTPLYATYQAEWGFTPITTTVVFGVYAIAVLSGLLVLGKLSDHVGRRPVLIAAIAAQAAAMLLFSTASGVGELLVARVVQGLSTGAALGAIGAGMMDINRARGTLANAFAPGVGTATGALVSGFVVQYLPAPTHTVYLCLLAVFVAQAVAVALIDETVTRKSGAAASLVPEIRLPRTVRGAVLATAPVMFAVWALAGFYGSLGPALVRTLVGSTSAVYGGLGLFVLAFVAASSVLVLRAASATTVMYTGIAALVAGVTRAPGGGDPGVAGGFWAGGGGGGRGGGARVPGGHTPRVARD